MTTKKLTRRQRILVATTLFGMFFGAGNLIFPVHLGQMAGSNVIPAIIGFIITAVGIPIFGVAAIGVTHADGAGSGLIGIAFAVMNAMDGAESEDRADKRAGESQNE